MMSKLRIFFSYCHKDEEALTELQKWLTPLHDKGFIEAWSDRHLLSGEDLTKIDRELEAADVIVLMLSQDYLASSACKKEMAFAIDNKNRKSIIPIIIRRCTWKETDCSNILALPTDGKPIDEWNVREEAWDNVFHEIKLAT